MDLNRFRRGWTRPNSVRLASGLLYASGPDSIYDPFNMPNLPNAFAKVDDAKSAEKFVWSYGHLGYAELLQQEEGTRSKNSLTQDEFIEPLEWILAQADTVRFALYILEALGFQNKKKIREVLTRKQLSIDVPQLVLKRDGLIIKRTQEEWQLLLESSKKPNSGLTRYGPLGPFSLGAILNCGYDEFGFRTMDGDEIFHYARDVIVYLVNENTRNIRYELYNNYEGGLAGILSAAALIEIIWHLVGQMAFKAEDSEGRDRIYIRNCKECHMPFFATDQRQRFCPPEAPSKYSLCGLRNRKRRQRSLKKGGTK